MKLSELDPRWFAADGQRAGFSFLCPHCRKTRLACKTIPLAFREQARIFAAEFPGNGGDIVLADDKFCWTITGADFASLTVSPSIDASKSGHWHGIITKGDIK